MYKQVVFGALAITVILLGGCARVGQRSSSSDTQISLSVLPSPPMIGDSQLIIRVTDGAGRPINDASLAIKGDMTHAGMVPILAELNGGGDDGFYSVPFQWTMAGDWVVTIDATLSDGVIARQRIDLSVLTKDEALCTHDNAE